MVVNMGALGISSPSMAHHYILRAICDINTLEERKGKKSLKGCSRLLVCLHRIIQAYSCWLRRLRRKRTNWGHQHHKLQKPGAATSKTLSPFAQFNWITRLYAASSPDSSAPFLAFPPAGAGVFHYWKKKLLARIWARSHRVLRCSTLPPLWALTRPKRNEVLWQWNSISQKEINSMSIESCSQLRVPLRGWNGVDCVRSW
jgi:hypothetical protein